MGLAAKDSVTIRAPASTANLGPGFDVFGLAIDAFYDTVTVTKKKGVGGRITVVVDGGGGGVPAAVSRNTAGLVARNIAKRFGIRSGLEVCIRKGVPAGFGMGSSAASAAAAAVAMNKLFALGMDANELVRWAGTGERAAAGAVHYDNVAAAVLGGFVIVAGGGPAPEVIKVRPPRDLVMCVAVPTIKVPKRKTMVSRGVIPARVLLEKHVKNVAGASAMVAGFFMGDPAMIGRAANGDVIVEEARRRTIPGFDAVKRRAIRAGALGVTISGAGPSVIAFGGPGCNPGRIAGAMKAGFAGAGVESRVVVCKPARGAVAVRRR